MATDHSKHDPLRNPQVDYERSDLSPGGILWFLIGLFICGVFIELVIWGNVLVSSVISSRSFWIVAWVFASTLGSG